MDRCGDMAKTSDDLVIMPALLTDAPVILDLQRLAYQSEAALNNDYSIPPLTQTLPEWEADFQRQVYLKAMRDGTIIGAVRGYEQNGTCYIGRLVVHPSCQNQGIGAQLLRAIETHFNAVKRYELFTSERSTRNLYLYQKLGYHTLRTEPLSAAQACRQSSGGKTGHGKVTIVYLEKMNQRDQRDNG
jgi:ribosomal protein S18 acetylase RimI-like enzyme